ncbi:MAG: protein-L-isoaspartate(D-aspartate) O-methyltransferase [Planctomycetes bacterium]|nr:protein-L-isoaspartate(D-aspartate) O-methyltransferase [Planctomycetota bacterium]
MWPAFDAPEQQFDEHRRRMVREQLRGHGIADERVLAAMARVPRHRLVPDEWRSRAYDNRPLPIGENQTISQPYMVAIMTQLLRLQGHERVLEIGTGSGYQAAVLAELAAEVFTIERLPELGQRAAQTLSPLGYGNIRFGAGDGSVGWPEHAPYHGIVVTAGAPAIPARLVEQLLPHGHLVVPVTDGRFQVLHQITRDPDGGFHTNRLFPCAFVPLIGEQGYPPGGN